MIVIIIEYVILLRPLNAGPTYKLIYGELIL